jgi:hypothetical protein
MRELPVNRNHRLGLRIGGLLAGMAFGLGAAHAQGDVERARQNMEQAARDNASSRAQEQAQRDYWRAQEAAEANRRQQADQQRRSQEQSDREKKSYSPNGEWGPGGGAPPAMSAGGNAQNSAALKALRAKLVGMPPLPDERNPLLGRWRVESDDKPQRKDELGQLMGMLANPGGAACQFTFGAGIIEFKSKSWASIDGHGDDSLGPIAYRADGKRVFALPAKGIELMGFDVAPPNRVVVVNIAGCALVRVAGTTTTTQSRPSSRALLASNATAPPAAGAAPKSSTAVQAAGIVFDGAAFRCGDGSLLHVSHCQGNADDATCTLNELHLPGLQMGKPARRADIVARVKGCEAGGIRYSANDKPVFVR